MESCGFLDIAILVGLDHFVHFLADDMGCDRNDAFAADSDDRQGQIVITTVEMEAFRCIGSDIACIVEVAAGILDTDDIGEIMGELAQRLRFDLTACTSRYIVDEDRQLRRLGDSGEMGIAAFHLPSWSHLRPS